MDSTPSPYRSGIRSSFAGRLRRLAFGAVAFVVVGWGTSFDAWGATYYVDQAHANARDTNPGTSEDAPWLTLPRAMQLDIVAGDTVYVKNGTYVDSTPAVESDPTPKFYPVNSGTATAPIAFRAYTPVTGARHRPVVSRNLSPGAGENSPVIGNNNRDYIVWDGFTLAAGTDIRIQDCTGCVVESLLIDKGPPSAGYAGSGNYDGIRLERTVGVTVRNNVVRNVYYAGDSHHNAAAIKLYSTSTTRIYNNELYNCNAGIYDKQNGVSNVFERNYIHDANEVGILFGGYQIPACGTCPVENTVVRQNVISNSADFGVRFDLSDPSRNRNIDVYNNVIYNVTRGVVLLGAIPDIDVYNNVIFTRASGSYAAIQINDMPSDWASNFNNFLSASGGQVRTRVPSGYESLAVWQTSRGYDVNTSTTAPQFAGPLTGTPLVTAFRLQSTSPLINAGRVGGLSTGVSVNVGAYIAASDAIGPQASEGAPEVIPPSPPTGLVVR